MLKKSEWFGYKVVLKPCFTNDKNSSKKEVEEEEREWGLKMCYKWIDDDELKQKAN